MRCRSFRGGVPACPQRQQHRHDVGRRDLIDGLFADAGVGVIAQAPEPLLFRPLRVPPDFAVDRDHLLDRLREGRHAICPPPLGQRVAAGARDLAVGQRELPRIGQRYERVAAEAECAGLATDHEPLHPTPGSGSLDVQVEAITVAVPPGLGDGAAQRSRQGTVGMWTPALGARPLLGE